MTLTKDFTDFKIKNIDKTKDKYNILIRIK